jgi:hypothetical protein
MKNYELDVLSKTTYVVGNRVGQQPRKSYT